jgi:hypothetical protein
MNNNNNNNNNTKEKSQVSNNQVKIEKYQKNLYDEKMFFDQAYSPHLPLPIEQFLFHFSKLFYFHNYT